MKIKRLDYQDHVFQFKHGEYVMSHVTQKNLPIRVLRLETDDGHVGWGEIVRKPTLDAPAIAALEVPLLANLLGKSMAMLPAYVRELSEGDMRLRGLAFGLDCAYLDWFARRCDLPMYSLLGGRRTQAIPEYYSLGGGDGGDISSALAAEALDWQVVQIKLGVGDPQADCQRVREALDCLAPQQTILADFNGALDVDAAEAIISEFVDPRIVWEEPCNSVERNTQVARRTRAAVMFDQCLHDLSSYTRVVAEGIAHSVCLKAPFLGSLSVALAAREMCIAGGMKMRIDGPWCGHIASAVCLHLAVGVPSDLLIAGCDLRQPLLLHDDWGGTEHLAQHKIAPSAGAGHGATPP